MSCKRRCVFVIVVFLLVVFQAGCENEAMASGRKVVTEGKAAAGEAVAAVSQAHVDGPRLLFEKTVHDFGEIAPRSKHNCSFPFTNTGNEKLVIHKVKKTCGCTPFELKKKEYEPGESGEIKVSYSGTSKPGRVSKSLYVESNDPCQPKQKFQIKAVVVEKVSYEPRRIKLLLNDAEEACPPITIRSLDGNAFHVQEFTSTGNILVADVNCEDDVNEITIQPKVNAEFADKHLQGKVKIEITHPGNSVINIPFEIVPPYSANPPTLIVLKAKPGVSTSRTIWVLSNYGDDFEVVNISSENGTIEVDEKEKVGARYEMSVTITPPDRKGNERFTSDTLQIEMADGKSLEISCRMFYQ